MTWVSRLTEASTVVAVNSLRQEVKVTGRAGWVHWWRPGFCNEPPLPFAGDLVMVGAAAYPIGYVPPSYEYPNQDWDWK